MEKHSIGDMQYANHAMKGANKNCKADTKKLFDITKLRVP
jgi:hypothetical protein